MSKLDSLYFCALCAWKNFVSEKRGDTNFISIVVVLAIVVALAVIFSTNANTLVTTMWGKITGNTSGLG